MNIDKVHVCEEFANYTDKYNSKDTKIKLKIDHTYRVAEICERIAVSIGLEAREVQIAWLIGMLHDIGRFEQVRIYNTFSDAQSIDHAHFGADLLFKEGLIDSYLHGCEGIALSQDDLRTIELAIRNHSAYRVEDGLTEKELIFCNIIRDADKIDILRVNTELPIEEIYNVSTEEIKTSAVTPEVLAAFNEEHAVLRSLKKTPIDNVVGHISLVYELVFDESYLVLQEQGWIYKMLDFKSDNPDTVADLKKIKEHMMTFIDNKIQTIGK